MPDTSSPVADDPDDGTKDPFKRRVAVAAALLTVLGAAVAYCQTRDSVLAGRAARDAQEKAIEGFGAQAAADSQFNRAYGVYVQSQLLERRAIVSAGRARFAGGGAESAAFEGERAGWEAVQASLTDLSPLLSDAEFGPDSGAPFPEHYLRTVSTESDELRLTQAASAETAAAHGSKAGVYLRVVTALAVALFLLGLSAIMPARGRLVMLGAGCAVAAFALLWTGTTLRRGVPHTPRAAIRAVAEGNRLVAERRFDEAVTAYGKAIALRPDYGLAYVYRADAQFRSGSPQTDTPYASISDEAHLRAAVADQERAVRFGAGDDVGLLGNLGFNYFLNGHYDESVRFTRRALARNGNAPTLVYNLGVAELARGKERAAEAAYEEGNRLNTGAEEGDDLTRFQTFASARTDLELLVRQQPAKEEQARRFSEKVTAAEAGYRLGRDIAAPPAGAAIRPGGSSTTGPSVRVDFTPVNIPEGTPTAYIWFYRAAADQPWDQISHLDIFEPLPAGLAGGANLRAQHRDCPTPGDYRVDFYVGSSRLQSMQHTVKPSAFGTLVVERDLVRGVSLCRPESWTRDQTPGLDAYTFKNGSVLLSVSTLVAPIEATANPVQFVESAIDAVTTGSGNTRIGGFQDVEIGGLPGRVLVLDAGGVGRLAFAAALGPDSVLRIIAWGGVTSEYERVGDELVPSISFDVPF